MCAACHTPYGCMAWAGAATVRASGYLCCRRRCTCSSPLLPCARVPSTLPTHTGLITCASLFLSHTATHYLILAATLSTPPSPPFSRACPSPLSHFRTVHFLLQGKLLRQQAIAATISPMAVLQRVSRAADEVRERGIRCSGGGGGRRRYLLMES